MISVFELIETICCTFRATTTPFIAQHHPHRRHHHFGSRRADCFRLWFFPYCFTSICSIFTAPWRKSGLKSKRRLTVTQRKGDFNNIVYLFSSRSIISRMPNNFFYYLFCLCRTLCSFRSCTPRLLGAADITIYSNSAYKKGSSTSYRQHYVYLLFLLGMMKRATDSFCSASTVEKASHPNSRYSRKMKLYAIPYFVSPLRYWMMGNGRHPRIRPWNLIFY